MGGSNVKSLKDIEKQHQHSASVKQLEPVPISGHNDDKIDDIVDFQMDGVVSKLQHKQLVTKVDVKGAIGQAGDVITLRPDVEALNEEESTQMNICVKLVKSQIQSYVLPPYIASEVQAKVPSQMLATVVKDLRLEAKKSSMGLKEDDTRSSEAAFAMDLMEQTTSPTPKKSRRQDITYAGVSLPSKDEFTVNTFVEKYSVKGSELIEPAVRSLSISIPSADSLVSAPGTNLDSVRFRANSPLRQDREKNIESIEKEKAADKITTLGMLSSRHRVKEYNLEAAESLKEDALIRNLLAVHAKEVGLPAPNELYSDSDNSEPEDIGDDKHTLYLSDDSSTEELYQKSILQFSPVNSAVLLKPPRKLSRSKKGGPGYRVMNDDDFDNDDDYDDSNGGSDSGSYSGSDSDSDSDSESNSDSESDDGSESDMECTNSAVMRYANNDDDSEDLHKDMDPLDSESLDAGVSMNIKDLLQFSCSCVDVRMLLNNNSSVVLSDEEDDGEMPSRKRLTKKRSLGGP